MDLTISNRLGEHFERVPVRPRGAYVLSIDPGQSSDPTAIAILDAQVSGTDKWRLVRGASKNLLYEDKAERFHVRHLERMPLGTSYVAIADYIHQMLQRDPLNQDCVDVLVDNTGVGRAFADVLANQRIKFTRITITAGNEVVDVGDDHWHVAKIALISALDARLNCGELKIAQALTESGALRSELKDFRRHISDAGRSTYAARANAHDDLVLAVAMGVWWVGRLQKGEYSCSYVSGHY
jgi:hypothetical protein